MLLNDYGIAPFFIFPFSFSRWWPCLNSSAAPLISVIVPNYNGAATIGGCLEALAASDHRNFEIIVVDDGSGDGSVALINSFIKQHRNRQGQVRREAESACRLITLKRRRGASAARNAGAAAARGGYLFFIDADCLVLPDTLSLVARAAEEHGAGVVVGGTYTLQAYDAGFFSNFQSTFIHHFETKRLEEPDYIASHAMLIAADTFKAGGGFPEAFMPIIEDVEFSHRLRRHDFILRMAPQILVRHVFNYDLRRSLANAYRKARYWTTYSLANRDLLTDSGTASRELKINVAAWGVSLLLLLLALLLWWLGPESAAVVGELGNNSAAAGEGVASPWALLFTALVVQVANGLEQRPLLASFYRAGGIMFALGAGLYYALLYPLPVGFGALRGALGYLAGEEGMGHGR